MEVTATNINTHVQHDTNKRRASFEAFEVPKVSSDSPVTHATTQQESLGHNSHALAVIEEIGEESSHGTGPLWQHQPSAQINDTSEDVIDTWSDGVSTSTHEETLAFLVADERDIVLPPSLAHHRSRYEFGSPMSYLSI